MEIVSKQNCRCHAIRTQFPWILRRDWHEQELQLATDKSQHLRHNAEKVSKLVNVQTGAKVLEISVAKDDHACMPASFFVDKF